MDEGMGYDSTLAGELRIEPPLKWAQIKDSQHLGCERARENSKGVCLVERSDPVETDEGTLNRRYADSLAFAWDYPVRLYEIVDEIQALVDAYPDHEFTGELRGEGCDFGDIWLLRVNAGRRVERILPTITWPDGTVLKNERYRTGLSASISTMTDFRTDPKDKGA